MDRNIQRLDNLGQICIHLWRPPQAFLCVSILGYSSFDNYKSYILGENYWQSIREVVNLP